MRGRRAGRVRAVWSARVSAYKCFNKNPQGRTGVGPSSLSSLRVRSIELMRLRSGGREGVGASLVGLAERGAGSLFRKASVYDYR